MKDCLCARESPHIGKPIRCSTFDPIIPPPEIPTKDSQLHPLFDILTTATMDGWTIARWEPAIAVTDRPGMATELCVSRVDLVAGSPNPMPGFGNRLPPEILRQALFARKPYYQTTACLASRIRRPISEIDHDAGIPPKLGLSPRLGSLLDLSRPHRKPERRHPGPRLACRSGTSRWKAGLNDADHRERRS